MDAYADDVFTAPASLTGLPALSVPCGEDSAGLPIGVQLIGEWRFDLVAFLSPSKNKTHPKNGEKAFLLKQNEKWEKARRQVITG